MSVQRIGKEDVHKLKVRSSAMAIAPWQGLLFYETSMNVYG